MDLKAHSAPPSAMDWVPPPQLRLPRAPSMALGTSRDGALTALGSSAGASFLLDQGFSISGTANVRKNIRGL